MNLDLLHQNIRAGIDPDHEEKKTQEKQAKVTKRVDPPPEPPKKFPYLRNKKSEIVIEKRKLTPIKPGREEYFVDKARAAAMTYGLDDIKTTGKSELTHQVSESDEADIAFNLMFGMREIRNKNLENGVFFLSKAIEMNPNDQGALIARSKCLLQLGEPDKALLDAETALALDKNSIRAIYQKAEALYFLGNFEHSLMFFHRGLRLRPELACFRLGVQKTQEAIENTIGGVQKADLSSTASAKSEKISSLLKQDKSHLNKNQHNRKQSRKLLGELFVDKEYLENLLKHPDLKRADTKTENISAYAQDAISFLNNRQEFWRQQKPTNILNC